jgi:hypothetical protein
LNEAVEGNGVCDHVLVIDDAQHQLSFLLSQSPDEFLMVCLDPLFLGRIPGEGIKVVIYGLQYFVHACRLLVAPHSTTVCTGKQLLFSYSKNEAQTDALICVYPSADQKTAVSVDIDQTTVFLIHDLNGNSRSQAKTLNKTFHRSDPVDSLACLQDRETAFFLPFEHPVSFSSFSESTCIALSNWVSLITAYRWSDITVIKFLQHSCASCVASLATHITQKRKKSYIKI